MNTQDVAHRLIQLVRQNESHLAYQELYSQNCESKEKSPMGELVHLKGLESILSQAEKMQENTEEFHSLTVSEPLVAGNFFSVKMVLDAKWKGMDRMAMEEICVYKVEEGKIISQEFFY